MTRLHRLFHEQGQSPWLDNLTRPYLRGIDLADVGLTLVRQGLASFEASMTHVVGVLESKAHDYAVG
jgi:transaldolase